MSIEVRHLSKRYGDVCVVDDVSSELPQGEVISLIGPNGAGKSTVFGMVCRLLERSSGDILLDGRDVGEWDAKDLARRMAILPQTHTTQMKITVEELVSFGRFPHSGSHLTADDRTIVTRAIDYMELGDFRDRFIDEMSGGQRQRAFIAMVLAQDTDYVFLDEPTNNLDVYHATRMMKLVRRLCDELGKTVVLVLHEINLAAFYSDRILAFREGQLVVQGTVKDVMTEKNLKRIYGVDFQIHEVDGKPLSIYH